MAEPDPIQFVHESAALIISEMKNDLEDRLQRQIAPSDIEMLLINGFAYRELLLRASINHAANQNLVSFSSGIALEYLGELVNVHRLPPTSAKCKIGFSFGDGHSGIIVPSNTRIQTTDGKAIFVTISETIIPEGLQYAVIDCEATETGSTGNAYPLNSVSIILDPLPFLLTASNTSIPAGGADEESDESLRNRIKLAPSTFSVAGPSDAYKFFAQSANPLIKDVAIKNHFPEPGSVTIIPLLEGGEIPTQEILDEVFHICNSDKIRPLNDTVHVIAPTVLEYSIVVELTLTPSAIASEIMNEVINNINAFVESRKNKIGLDVVKNRVLSLCMVKDKVYEANIVSPSSNIVAEKEVYAKCTGITVTIIGTHDE